MLPGWVELKLEIYVPPSYLSIAFKMKTLLSNQSLKKQLKQLKQKMEDAVYNCSETPAHY